MQRRCKKTLANFDSVPAAKRHFHKVDILFKVTVRYEESERDGVYLHGFVQSFGKVQLFVFKALNWNREKGIKCVQ